MEHFWHAEAVRKPVWIAEVFTEHLVLVIKFELFKKFKIWVNMTNFLSNIYVHEVFLDGLFSNSNLLRNILHYTYYYYYTTAASCNSILRESCV